MGFFRQGYWGGLPFPSPWDLPNPGTEPVAPATSTLQADSLPLSHGRHGSQTSHTPSSVIPLSTKKHTHCFWASLVAQRLKCLPAMWKTWVRSLGWEDSLEKEWQPIPWRKNGNPLQYSFLENPMDGGAINSILFLNFFPFPLPE